MSKPPTRVPSPGVIARNLAIALVALALGFWAFALLLGTVNSVSDSYEAMSRDVAESNDFPMFYAAGENVISADREHSYEKPFIVESILRQWTDPQSEEAQELLPWLRYYNPPFYLFALSPLTLLDMHEAFIATVAINVVALAVLLFLIGVALEWRKKTVFFVALATLGFLPLTPTIFHGQPTLLISMMVLAAFLLAQRGKTTIASLLVALCTAKPQLAIAAALPLVRQCSRAVTPLAIIGLTLTLAPFIFLGAGALYDYVLLVFGRGGDDLAEADYASHVLSWPGFMVALTGSLQPIAAALLSVVTLGLLATVLRHGDRFLTWPASIIALLTVVPHSHPQDWMLAVPAAVILLARPMHTKVHLVTMALLAMTFIAVNSWMISSGIVYDGGRAFYAPTPMAFALIAWCALLPVVEGRAKVIGTETGLAAASAA